MDRKSSHTEALKAFRTTRYASQFTDEAISFFFSSVDCPRALTCWLLFRYNEHEQLVNLDCNPSDYDTCDRFNDAYASTSFLSKANFLSLTVSKRDAALEKFHEYEALCGRTNTRFKNLHLDPTYTGSNVWLLNRTWRKIEEILGGISADEFANNANWGPGVSTLMKGAEVSAYNKFRAERGITRELYSLIEPWFDHAYPSWRKYAADDDANQSLDTFFSIQDGNSIVTVPKNSKTDRVIAIEPGFNIFFQKSLGTAIRRRLKREGIDLNTQERNQELSREASIDDSLATIDFSSASDSISYETVRALIPDDRWFTLLESCRSKYGVLDGKRLKWAKFSAMGNGFTFELESLIFFAAAWACCDFLHLRKEKISVFGDDVIIPVAAASLYSDFCAFLGFRVNQKKSFSSGHFRESCGAHYYQGVDCKPVYLKGKIQNVESVFKLANGVRAYAHRRTNRVGCCAKYRQYWRHLYQSLPKSVRIGIPLGYGDGGLAMNLDEANPALSRGIAFLPKPARRGFEGFLVSMVAFVGVSRTSDHQAMLLTRLAQVSTERSYSNEYTLRGTVRVRLLPHVLVPQWYNLGPWIKS